MRNVIYPFLLLLHVSAIHTRRAPGPVFRSADGAPLTLFTGTISMSEKEVTVTPRIRATSASGVCSYSLRARGTSPFDIEPTEGGEYARVFVKPNASLDIKRRRKYKLRLSAFDCATEQSRSQKAILVVTIVDEKNENSPIFDHDSYTKEIEQGTLPSSLLTVHADDADSGQAGEICDYMFLNETEQFTISSNGEVRAVQALNSLTSYKLLVVAQDCAGRISDSITIAIHVKPKCISSWKGVEESTGSSSVYSSAQLSVCCEPEEILVNVSEAGLSDLAPCTSIQQCDAADAIDVLRAAGAVQTSHNYVSSFDGAVAVDVPRWPEATDEMSVMFWLRHVASSTKQHVICSSDASGMNRHHFSISLRNSHLSLLLRRKHDQQKNERYSPAVFRWNVNEISDGLWHHYSIIVTYPKVTLYVDGRVIDGDSGPNIADDHPLHASARAQGMSFTVGACWQGIEKTYIQQLHGDLSGVTLVPRAVTPSFIQCVITCPHRLSHNGEIASNTRVSVGKSGGSISVAGQSVDTVGKAVQSLVYTSIENAQPTLEINTRIRCDSGDEIQLPMLKTQVKTVVTSTTPPTTTSTTTYTPTKASSQTSESHEFGSADETEDEVETHGADDEDVVEDELDTQSQDSSDVFSGSNQIDSAKQSEQDDFEIEDDTKTDNLVDKGVVHTFSNYDRQDEEVEKITEKQNEPEAVDTVAAKKAFEILADNMLTYSRQELVDGVKPFSDLSIIMKTGLAIDSCSIQRVDAEFDPQMSSSDLFYSKDLLRAAHLTAEWTHGHKALIISGEAAAAVYVDVLNELGLYVSQALDTVELTLSCSSRNYTSPSFDVQISVTESVDGVAHAQVDMAVNEVESNRLSSITARSSTTGGTIAVIVLSVGLIAFFTIFAAYRLKKSRRSGVSHHQVVKVNPEDELEWDDSNDVSIIVNPQAEFEEDGLYDSDEESCDCSDSGSDEDCFEKSPKSKSDMEWDHSAVSF